MLMINKIFKRLKNKEHAISIIIIAVIFGFLIVSVVAQEVFNKKDISNTLTNEERDKLILLGYSSSTWVLEDCYDNNMAMFSLYNSNGEKDEFGISMLGKSCEDIKSIEDGVAEYIKSKLEPPIVQKEEIKQIGIIEVKK